MAAAQQCHATQAEVPVVMVILLRSSGYKRVLST
jgi:hypothetical protein